MTCVAAVLMALAAGPAGARTADPPAWQATLGDLVRAEKAGFGGLCGVAVDPATGTVWINLSDRGFYRSDDQAQTFRRCGGHQPKGRTESPRLPAAGPDRREPPPADGPGLRRANQRQRGRRRDVASLDAQSGHTDWCAADWTDPDLKFVLALKHEAGGLLLASRDRRATFSEVGKGYGPGWVFDDTTAVVAGGQVPGPPNPPVADDRRRPEPGGRAARTARSGPAAPRRCRNGTAARCTGWSRGR